MRCCCSPACFLRHTVHTQSCPAHGLKACQIQDTRIFKWNVNNTVLASAALRLKRREKCCIPPLGGGTAVLLSPPPEVDQQPVLEGVDSFVSVKAWEAWLALSLSLCVNGRKSQEVILVTEPSNGSYVQKRSLWSHLGMGEEKIRYQKIFPRFFQWQVHICNILNPIR